MKITSIEIYPKGVVPLVPYQPPPPTPEPPTLTIPTITDVSPTSGTTDGGTLITITGTDFLDVFAVTIDGTQVSFSIVDDNTITATTHVHSAGIVDVRVQNAAGLSTIGSSDNFTFV